MKEGLLIAKEKGCVLSTLEVRESNEAAIGLYKKYGYEQVAKRKNYYNNPDEAAVLMNKEM
jgi:ribosomal-protein-alanine N-acetyltransferase